MGSNVCNVCLVKVRMSAHFSGLRGIQLTFLVGRIYVRELTIERVGMRDKN